MKYIVIMIAMMVFGSSHAQPLQTVEKVDLARYAGKWFEIASFPASFQKNCTCTTAEYTVMPKGYVKVVNKCNKKTPEGRLAVAKGKAYVVDTNTNAKLKVSFFWPFYGDYNIIDLAPDYSYAVVGTTSREYLWILSRTPVMDANLYDQLAERAKAKGFDITRLNKTMQLDNCAKPTQ